MAGDHDELITGDQVCLQPAAIRAKAQGQPRKKPAVERGSILGH